ncbi:MAG: hypothetical protein WC696_02235 [Candidatus Methylopumilus sp.]|jgi:hypothetical protein
MVSFAQRYGYVPLEKIFQRERVEEALRTQLWNVLKISTWDLFDSNNERYDENSKKINSLLNRLWFHYFNNDLDNLPHFKHGQNNAYTYIKNYFFSCKWFEVYGFLEFLSQDASNLLNADDRVWINETLEHHNAAYRFVECLIVEITDQNEIESIESALNHPQLPVKAHLKSALEKLSDKEKPDYRNSVKESISAVEAACRVLADSKSATLGDALKKIKNLHPVMKQAFDKLYGYTSDASGVRHSLIDEATISYADAKFMLVTCSAFVSYLNTTIAK